MTVVRERLAVIGPIARDPSGAHAVLGGRGDPPRLAMLGVRLRGSKTHESRCGDWHPQDQVRNPASLKRPVGTSKDVVVKRLFDGYGRRDTIRPRPVIRRVHPRTHPRAGHDIAHDGEGRTRRARRGSQRPGTLVSGSCLCRSGTASAGRAATRLGMKHQRPPPHLRVERSSAVHSLHVVRIAWPVNEVGVSAIGLLGSSCRSVRQADWVRREVLRVLGAAVRE